eukprot:1280852-Prorocentrum_lima.AAC.1
MTSSLVGSEMCIRDRGMVARSGQCCRADVVGWQRKRKCRPAESFGEDPVSYTHLTLPTICSV